MLSLGVLLGLVAGFLVGAGRPVVEKQVARTYYRVLAGRAVGELPTCAGSGSWMHMSRADDRGVVTCPWCSLPVKAPRRVNGDREVLVIEEHGG